MRQYDGWRMLGLKELVKAGDVIAQITDHDEWAGVYKSCHDPDEAAVLKSYSEGNASDYIVGSYSNVLRVFRKNELFKNKLSLYFAAPAPLP